ncbi:SDR family oxidoreductase [Flavitalea sp. BT771]|uniref:SDR family NAD(P)-dependent oxidoreductase n=1 Tax=Flavitalea sp. BT771 TaxID=3063329 RepID=UPI0026E22EFC|nr:SDR family oxidoreductase [Flavitalea sp. BT771]MDO6430496.1 SDR family oxidoreductase [Flavitalea sp. BT771]MDV6219364.1 SDR family oxidoreductase [Flavitalea sp. BT771]
MQNKTAIVTGAGQGIGYEICRQLIARGVKVLLNDSDETLVQQAAERLGNDCIPMAGDAGDVDFIRGMVKEAVAISGRLDIVIANAGITLFGDFLTYTEASFNRVMQVNLGGSFFLAQAAALQMKRQGEGGSILFMSSVTGHQAHKDLAAYGMSKAALEMLARHLVIELSPYRITVNAVAPGATMTERTAGDAGYERTWSSLTPMGRPAGVADIAEAALFLVSSQARHITGQTLIVDGGWTAVSPNP